MTTEISQAEAIAKLKEIYTSAISSENARDFNLSIIEDEQLQEWFGTSNHKPKKSTLTREIFEQVLRDGLKKLNPDQEN